MRHRFRFAAVAALLVLCAVTLPAQAPRPVLAPGNTVLLAAYDCAADQLAHADALISEITTPILNKYVSSGKIISWGYMGVYLGGHANRHIYLWATDPVALMQARQAYLPEIQASPKFAEFTKICGSATITVHNLISIAGAPAK
jgi:hypothetical protein